MSDVTQEQGQGETRTAAGTMFDRRMLEALICPVTHSTLSYDSAAQELISQAAGLAFPVRDGIPVMLLSEAREL